MNSFGARPAHPVRQPVLVRERGFLFPDGKHGNAANPEHDADPARETNLFPKQVLPGCSGGKSLV
jgi:hypothetical protein